MKILVCLFVLQTSIAAATMNAQTVKDGTDALRSAIIKQQRYMRGFSADPETHWRWKDGALIAEMPKVKILSALFIKSVKVSGNKVEITADRYAVFRNKDTKLTLSPLNETARVIVDLTGADIAVELPKLADALFYQNVNDAVAALPSTYKKSVPPYFNPADNPKIDSSSINCDCADAIAGKCGDPDNVKNIGIKSPRLIRMVNPEFSDEARVHKLNAVVQTGFKVDMSGNVSDIWVVRPAAMGLDHSATNAVQQYRFAPASCNGHPIDIHLIVDVNFQIF